MPRPTKLVINTQTKEAEIVALTDEEIAENEVINAQEVAIREQMAIDIAAKEALKTSARAKLAAGEPLSAEEAELMIP